ncbi:monocarboxylate transporter 9-like [Dermacentor andersoni]|uniref:monocarboxylate transporter 9-like n=1 Tax=Dermacentor andersoni TaxID=34620 RepID=UPI002155A674|nr:monocarboxylate transporter 9-like [Dermacentor andersoni]
MRHRESSWNRRHHGPDGPWAWLVASAAAWNLFWLSLLRRSGGVIFVALVTAFGESRERTSWVISLNMSLAMLLGPVWGLLTKFLSLRTQTLLGCFIVGVSSILCYFARSLTSVIVLQGVCGGIGQGIVMPTKDLLIGYHFRRYRGSANGIYFIGGTLAAFLYPMVLLLLVQEYNLGGALLITGGLQLHALAGSLFYRKPPWAQAQNETEARRNSAGLKARGDDRYSTGREVSKSSNSYKTEEERTVNNRDVSHSVDGTFSKALVPCANGDATECNGAVGVADVVREEGQHGDGVLLNGAEYGNQETNRSSATASAAAALLSDEAGVAVEEGAATAVDRTDKDRRASSASSRHFGFLKYPVFYMIFVTCSFSAFSMLPFTVLVDYVKERGFSAQDGAILLSVRAIGDAISRPMSGVLSDRDLVDRRTLMCASKLTVAFVCALLPLATQSYAALLVLCVLLGWSTGTAVVLFVPIMADRVGVASLGLSMGFCRFAMGVGHLTCPIIIGHFKDELGSYEGLFYLSSIVTFLVGSLWLVDALRMVVIRRRRRRASAAVRWDAVPTSEQQSSAVHS